MPEITGDLNELIAWLQKRVPALMQSRENWKVVINSNQNGRLSYEILQTGEILPEHRQRQRLEERTR